VGPIDRDEVNPFLPDPCHWNPGCLALAHAALAGPASRKKTTGKRFGQASFPSQSETKSFLKRLLLAQQTDEYIS